MLVAPVVAPAPAACGARRDVALRAHDVTMTCKWGVDGCSGLAAVVMEPMRSELPRDGFLKQVAASCRAAGAVSTGVISLAPSRGVEMKCSVPLGGMLALALRHTPPLYTKESYDGRQP